MTSKEVQPFIKKTTKNVIYKISYITGQTVKQICTDLCLYSLANKKKLTEELKPFVKWTIKIEDTVYSPTDEPIKEYPLTGTDLGRVNVKIDLNSFEFARGLAYSLGWSIAKVIAYCIESSIDNFDFMNQYIADYLEMSMDENQKAIINKIMKDAKEEFDEELSVSAFLIGIVDEFKPTDQNVNEAVQQLGMKWG